MSARPGPPPWTLAVTAMLSVQLGAALSTGLIDTVGPAGTAWLRLSFGALVFLAIARPPLRTVRRADVPALLALGVTTGLQTTAFLAAIERIPLGTCVAIEFLGPLTVAGLRAHDRRALVWPVLALCGVVLLTEPSTGGVDAVGIALAAAAALGWGLYIVLTQHVGDRFDGLGGLALTTPVAAVTAAAVGIPQAAGHLDPAVLAAGAGLALLLPVLPYACELLALRRMSTSAFGTLMAVEPAIGVLLGAIVLAQVPTALQLLGVALVVTAGTAAQRRRRRPVPPAAVPARPGAQPLTEAVRSGPDRSPEDVSRKPMLCCATPRHGVCCVVVVAETTAVSDSSSALHPPHLNAARDERDL